DQDSHKDFDEIYRGFSPTSSQAIVLEKAVAINLKTQQLEQKVMGIAIAAYPVSTGMPGRPTPLGTYRVLSKSPRAWSSSAKLWMPYWMHFSGRGHGIHELPEWPGGRKEGADHLGKPVSHGCVRLGVGTAKKIYEWSPIGTKITVLAR
nr:L,D-transpeptidase [Patescibacteria group bacterium]